MNTNTLGVVIGRFQVPDLHDGHRHIIEHAWKRNDELLIVIGSGHGLATPRNPLPYPMRKAMIQNHFPKAHIFEHFDHPSNIVWSSELDRRIAEQFPHHQVTLYGSRDSFIPFYDGQYITELVEEVPARSGTELRMEACATIPHTPDFRRGIIHTHATRLPIPYPVIDVAIVRNDRNEVLLGQKKTDGDTWRFIGGFVDPALDTSLEHAVRREAYEETGGIEIGDPVYIGSSMVNDWRYQKDTDRILSAFFIAPYIFGAPRPSDDIDQLRWVPLSEVLRVLHPSHRPMGEMLMKSMAKESTS